MTIGAPDNVLLCSFHNCYKSTGKASLKNLIMGHTLMQIIVPQVMCIVMVCVNIYCGDSLELCATEGRA